jgi:hypothetical protein
VHILGQGKDEELHKVEESIRRAERLRQAILKRAFEGRLVPQVAEEGNSI